MPDLLASVPLLTTKTASVLLAPKASLPLLTTKTASTLLAPKASLPLLTRGFPSWRGKGEEKGLALPSSPHHGNPCPADGARGQPGEKGRGEDDLVGAALPLHHTDPCPAHGACGKLWGRGEEGERPCRLFYSTSPQRSPYRLRHLWPLRPRRRGEGGGRPCQCRASSAWRCPSQSWCPQAASRWRSTCCCCCYYYRLPRP